MIYVRDEAKGYDKVLVIGNKKDLADKREVSYEEANNECVRFGYTYMETSAKSGTNIDVLKNWMDSHTENKVEQELQRNSNKEQQQDDRIRLESVALNIQNVDKTRRKKMKFC